MSMYLLRLYLLNCFILLHNCTTCLWYNEDYSKVKVIWQWRSFNMKVTSTLHNKKLIFFTCFFLRFMCYTDGTLSTGKLSCSRWVHYSFVYLWSVTWCWETKDLWSGSQCRKRMYIDSILEFWSSVSNSVCSINIIFFDLTLLMYSVQHQVH